MTIITITTNVLTIIATITITATIAITTIVIPIITMITPTNGLPNVIVVESLLSSQFVYRAKPLMFGEAETMKNVCLL